MVSLHDLPLGEGSSSIEEEPPEKVGVGGISPSGMGSPLSKKSLQEKMGEGGDPLRGGPGVKGRSFLYGGIPWGHF